MLTTTADIQKTPFLVPCYSWSVVSVRISSQQGDLWWFDAFHFLVHCTNVATFWSLTNLADRSPEFRMKLGAHLLLPWWNVPRSGWRCMRSIQTFCYHSWACSLCNPSHHHSCWTLESSPTAWSWHRFREQGICDSCWESFIYMLPYRGLQPTNFSNIW